MVTINHYEDAVRNGRFNYDPAEYDYRRNQRFEMQRAMMQSARIFPRKTRNLPKGVINAN